MSKKPSLILWKLQHSKIETAIAAIETLLWLEDGAPHKFDGVKDTVYFDMKNFIMNNTCGTTCCIAGAISLFKNTELKETIAGTNTYLHSLHLDAEFNTDPYLDKKDRDVELSKLFYGFKNKWDRLQLSAIKPAHAAVVFRNYLFTGKTDWTLQPKAKQVEIG